MSTLLRDVDMAPGEHMSTSETVSDWLRTYHGLTAEADATKNSQAVAFGMLAEYDKLAPSQRHIIHEVLSKWLVSTDNKERYDARFIASQRRIAEMKPAIIAAIERAESLPGPEAFYEAKSLRRVLADLG